MRRIFSMVAILLAAASAYAQRPNPSDDKVPPPMRCCTPKVYDAGGKLVGELVRWDDRFPTQPLQAFVKYPVKGDDVILVVASESITSVTAPGGGTALFTTPDCSGPKMMAMIPWPPLAKRYAMVLPVGPPASLGIAATSAWLWVSDPLPTRVNPAGTTFHSQWDSGSCQPIPSPGLTVPAGPWGGFWMTRVEDLMAKFKRPFYAE